MTFNIVAQKITNNKDIFAQSNYRRPFIKILTTKYFLMSNTYCLNMFSVNVTLLSLTETSANVSIPSRTRLTFSYWRNLCPENRNNEINEEYTVQSSGIEARIYRCHPETYGKNILLCILDGLGISNFVNNGLKFIPCT